MMFTWWPPSTSSVRCLASSRSRRPQWAIQLCWGWLGSPGEVVVVGVEGTGSYGAGLARHLQREGVAVVEVDRPNRQRRRRQGKSDPHDAVTAARAAQAGDALGAAKLRDGNVEAIRVLRVVRGRPYPIRR